MSGLVVDTDKCVGCRRCERVCANNGIEVTDRKAHVLDGCVMCGMCVDACPVGALAIEKDEAAGVDLAAWDGLWVFCQVGPDGEVLPVALELVAKGRELADARGCSLTAVLGEGGDAARDSAALLLAAGAGSVIRCRDKRLTEPDAEVYASWLCELVRERRPEAILYGATNFGRELAPRVAVLLQTGLTADCTILEVDAERGLLQQTRPAFGGNLMATIVCPTHRPQMATVRPGVFPAPELGEADVARAAASEAGHVEDVPLPDDASSSVTMLSREAAGSGAGITDADVLVVVGRGIGDKKALAPMRRLAELLGGKLGCTRPVVEAGWLGYEHQVGQTGVSVSPKLLVSVGCSGAIQHVAGIGGAECIVAINDDPTAPIFDVAQYKVVGDCHEVVDELVARLEARLA